MVCIVNLLKSLTGLCFIYGTIVIWKILEIYQLSNNIGLVDLLLQSLYYFEKYFANKNFYIYSLFVRPVPPPFFWGGGRWV